MILTRGDVNHEENDANENGLTCEKLFTGHFIYMWSKINS